MTTHPSPVSRHGITQGLTIASLLIAASFALKFASPAYLSPELGRRLFGILMGLILVFFANAVPKVLTPLMSTRCDPATEQAIRRFTGWTFMIGGVAYIAAWAFAPSANVDLLAGGLLTATLLVVVARCVWGLRARR